MMTRRDNKQMKFHLVTIENLVPEDYFLRKLDRLVDFFFCVSSSQKSRTVRVNIFEEAASRCHERRGTALHTYILGLRQIWCEGSFAAQKARHNLEKELRPMLPGLI